MNAPASPARPPDGGLAAGDERVGGGDRHERAGGRCATSAGGGRHLALQVPPAVDPPRGVGRGRRFRDRDQVADPRVGELHAGRRGHAALAGELLAHGRGPADRRVGEHDGDRRGGPRREDSVGGRSRPPWGAGQQPEKVVGGVGGQAGELGPYLLGAGVGGRRARAGDREAVARGGAVFELAAEGGGVVGGHGARQGRFAGADLAGAGGATAGGGSSPTSARPALSTPTHAPPGRHDTPARATPEAPSDSSQAGKVDVSWSVSKASPRPDTATHNPPKVQDAPVRAPASVTGVAAQVAETAAGSGLARA